MATLTTYTETVQDEVEDHSPERQSLVEKSVQFTYNEILSYVAKFLVGSTEEDVTASTSNRYVTPVNSYVTYDTILYHSASDTNFYTLKEITEDEYYERYVNSSSSEPTKYYVNGNVIYFDCVPSSAGTVRVVGLKVQDALTGSNVSIIPDRYENVLVTGAAARFKAFESIPDASEYQKIFKGAFWAQGRIDGLLGDMIRELSHKTRVIKPKLFGR